MQWNYKLQSIKGNAQVERYNGFIWTKSLKKIWSTNWQSVLPNALPPIRSLCIATKVTSHERLKTFPAVLPQEILYNLGYMNQALCY